MKEVFIVAIFIHDKGNTKIETSIHTDKTEAMVKIEHEYKFAQSKTKTEHVYSGYDTIPFWFEVGDTNEPYWVRGEIQVKSL